MRRVSAAPAPSPGDDGDDLVVVGVDQAVEQLGGRLGQAGGDDLDALPGQPQVVALGDRAGVADAGPNRPGDLAGHDRASSSRT